MTNKENEKEDEDEDNCNCGFIDSLDDFWNKYKYKISSPLSITLSICGATSGLLAPYFAVASSVAITLTNISIFFTSILLTKYMTENKHLDSDNINLKNDVRRLTIFQLSHTPNSNASTIKSNSDYDSIKSAEPINFNEMHRNNAIANYAFQN